MTLTREIRDIMGRISKMESQVSKLPSRISSSVGGGGGSAAEDLFVYAESFGELDPPTAVNRFARITDGAYKGMTCVVNADANGWVPFTHFG